MLRSVTNTDRRAMPPAAAVVAGVATLGAPRTSAAQVSGGSAGPISLRRKVLPTWAIAGRQNRGWEDRVRSDRPRREGATDFRLSADTPILEPVDPAALAEV